MTVFAIPAPDHCCPTCGAGLPPGVLACDACPEDTGQLTPEAVAANR